MTTSIVEKNINHTSFGKDPSPHKKQLEEYLFLIHHVKIIAHS